MNIYIQRLAQTLLKLNTILFPNQVEYNLKQNMIKYVKECDLILVSEILLWVAIIFLLI